MLDAITLTATGTHRDGEWIRVSRWGFRVADLRSVEQLAALVDLAALEEALLKCVGSNHQQDGVRHRRSK